MRHITRKLHPRRGLLTMSLCHVRKLSRTLKETISWMRSSPSRVLKTLGSLGAKNDRACFRSLNGLGAHSKKTASAASLDAFGVAATAHSGRASHHHSGQTERKPQAHNIRIHQASNAGTSESVILPKCSPYPPVVRARFASRVISGLRLPTAACGGLRGRTMSESDLPSSFLKMCRSRVSMQAKMLLSHLWRGPHGATWCKRCARQDSPSWHNAFPREPPLWGGALSRTLKIWKIGAGILSQKRANPPCTREH